MGLNKPPFSRNLQVHCILPVKFSTMYSHTQARVPKNVSSCNPVVTCNAKNSCSMPRLKPLGRNCRLLYIINFLKCLFFFELPGWNKPRTARACLCTCRDSALFNTMQTTQRESCSLLLHDIVKSLFVCCTVPYVDKNGKTHIILQQFSHFDSPIGVGDIRLIIAHTD